MKKSIRDALSPESVEFIERCLCTVDRDRFSELQSTYTASSAPLNEQIMSLAYCARHREHHLAIWMARNLCAVLLDAKDRPIKRPEKTHSLLRFVGQCRRACQNRLAATHLQVAMAAIGCKTAERTLSKKFHQFDMPDIAYLLWTFRKLRTRSSHRTVIKIATSARQCWIRVWAAALLVLHGCIKQGSAILHREKLFTENRGVYINVLLGLTWAGEQSAICELKQIAENESDKKVLETIYRGVFRVAGKSPSSSEFYGPLMNILNHKIDSIDRDRIKETWPASNF